MKTPMTKILSFAFILSLLFPFVIFADQVVMLNGDRVTGKIIKKDGETIILETEAMGLVKIRWNLVERIVSDEPLSLTLNDGKILEGKIEVSENKVNLKTSDAEKIEIDKKEVKIFRTPKEQANFEAEQRKLKEAKFTDFWAGTIDAGFSLTSGNSKTRTFTLGMRGIRETTANKLNVYANALQVKNSTSGKKVTTAQSIWTGGRYDLNFGQKWFAYFAGDFEYNKPQKLNLRAVAGSGAGFRAIRNDATNFDVTLGITHNYENFSTKLIRNSAEASFGEELKQKINPRVRLNQRFVFYPNLTRFGEFRALLDASLQTDINSWLGMHLTVGNRYNSQPVLQTKKNDFLLSTGLRFSLGKNRKK